MVSICDPNDLRIEWRAIPKMPGYQVSNLGLVRSHKRNSEGRLYAITETATSVGTYLTVNLTVDGRRRSVGIHQLTCEIFNGPPPNDGKVYEVNHIDGNKHNNLPSNVEWMTRRENTLHALMSGLRNDNVTISVHDMQTGEWTTHYSIVECSRQMGIPRHDVKMYCGRYRTTPWQGRWRFVIDLERLGNIIRPHVPKVKAWDYVTGKEISAASCSDMCYLTGIVPTTIARYIGIRSTPNFQPYKLLAGYVFKLDSDYSPYPIIDKVTAHASRDAYFK